VVEHFSFLCSSALYAVIQFGLSAHYWSHANGHILSCWSCNSTHPVISIEVWAITPLWAPPSGRTAKQPSNWLYLSLCKPAEGAHPVYMPAVRRTQILFAKCIFEAFIGDKSTPDWANSEWCTRWQHNGHGTRRYIYIYLYISIYIGDASFIRISHNIRMSDKTLIGLYIATQSIVFLLAILDHCFLAWLRTSIRDVSCRASWVLLHSSSLKETVPSDIFTVLQRFYIIFVCVLRSDMSGGVEKVYL